MTQCVYNGTTSNFTYASDGLRHRSVIGANTTDLIIDASMFVREKLNGAVAATYLVGARGPEYRRDDSAGTVRWYCFDGLGSVLGEVDTSGNLTASRSYDVYGAVRTSAGTSTSKHKFVGSLGHPSEDETGLINMRSRYVDPVSGRFLSEDRAKHGPNWFSYTNANPVNMFDRNGNDAVSDVLDAAWQYFILFLTGRISGPFAVAVLLRYIRRLSEIARFETLLGELEIDKAKADLEVGAFEGDAGDLEMQVADIELALASKDYALSALAKLSARTLELMIEIIELY